MLSSFAVRSKRIYPMGAPATVAFRIDARRALRDVRLYLVPLGSRTPASTIKLGRARARHRPPDPRDRHRERRARPRAPTPCAWPPRTPAAAGFAARAGISSTASLTYLHHRFPVAGPFSYGGADSRFGTGRKGHRHQGQDIAAAEGTPVVAPRGGTVKAVQYQAGGAGHYVVLTRLRRGPRLRVHAPGVRLDPRGEGTDRGAGPPSSR